MKAVILTAPGGVENLQLAEIATPVPAPEEVRIRIRAAGFNPSDYKMRQSGASAEQGPTILGGEVAGVIDAVAADVAEFRVGDAVCAYLPLKRGGYAEAVCSHTAFIAPKPHDLSFIQAAAVPLAGLTALTCFGRGTARPGAPLFVAGGSGGVGSFAIGLAKAEGASPIITTAGSDSSVRYLTQTLGMPADSIVRYDRIDDRQLASCFRAMNGEKSFPAALDFVGARMMTLCCELVDFDGCVTSIVQRPGNEDQELLSSKCAAFRFVNLRARAKHGDLSAWLQYGKDLRKLLDLVSRGPVRLPHVEHIGTLSAESVRAAHGLLEGKHVQGKLVMSVP
jgi:NADPH:quinone reductase-like Zn-dependent oxidoreductase